MEGWGSGRLKWKDGSVVGWKSDLKGRLGGMDGEMEEWKNGGWSCEMRAAFIAASKKRNYSSI